MKFPPPQNLSTDARLETYLIELKLGNCLELMGEIPDGSVDMICTDLPYGTTQCKWDAVIPLEPMWVHYWRVLKQNGVVALNASQPFTSILVASQLKNFKHEWIWIKNRGSNFANTVREPMKEHESVLIFSRGKWTYNRQMQERTGGGASRVQYGFEKEAPERTDCYGAFRYKRPVELGEMRVPSSWQKFNCEVGYHPTQKPVDLAAYLIRTYTNEGETVLDSCMGSGTTGVAAIKLGRRFIGIEKDTEHFNVADERLRGPITEPSASQTELLI